MRLFLLLFIFFWGAIVKAQPGTKQNFYFNLIDSAYNFNFEDDFHQVKLTEKEDEIKIVAGNFTYLITSIYGNLSVTENKLCCTYFQKSINHCNFLVTRKAPFGNQEMKFGISNLQENDFAEIQFFPNRQQAFVLPNNPNDRYYEMKVGKTQTGGRNITCFLYDGCEPKWVLSTKGKLRRDSLLRGYSEEIHIIQRNLAHEKLKNLFPNGLDTLMIKKVCETSRCTFPVGMINCQLAADTSCKEALFEYRFKGFEGPYDQKIVIQTKYPNDAWFTYPAYDNIKFSFRDTTILSRNQVLEVLRNNESLKGIYNENITLSFLALLPQFLNNKPIFVNGLLEANPSSEIIFDYSTPEDFPMLGYSFTTEEIGSNGNVVVYQYWINGRTGSVFRKSTFWYNLMDE